MAKKFRVLVIDDDSEVIARLDKRVSTKTRNENGKRYAIELVAVHILVADDGDRSTISGDTLNTLAEVCKKPLSLIVADFGYVKKEILEILKAKYQRDGKLTKRDTDGKILTTKDLVESIEIMKGSSKKSLLLRNLVNSSAKFYLYSYPSKEFIDVFGEIEDRETLTQSYFKNCKVVGKDTRAEFYARRDFDPYDSPEHSKHDSGFYSHLASKLIDKIIQLEFVEFILSDLKRAKNFPLKQFSTVIGIGTVVGLGSEFLGARLFHLFKEGEILTGISFGLLAIATLIILGIGVYKFVERGIIDTSNRGSDSDDAE